MYRDHEFDPVTPEEQARREQDEEFARRVRREVLRMERGEAEEDIRGDVTLTHFIIGITDLRALQVGGQVLLKQVPILPQVTDASIHGFVPPFWDVTKSIDKTKCFIDIYNILLYH